jgi:transposase InsO family protein
MDEELREEIALFRFAVITPLVSQRHLGRGEREALLRQITEKEWRIPGSPRTRIARSTVLKWLAGYLSSGQNIESLKPKRRRDAGSFRSIDSETEAALVALRHELPEASLPVLLKVARERNIIDWHFGASQQSIYRLFQRHGLHRLGIAVPVDRRRFEAELPNDLWQSDCMHGPRVIVGGKLRKSFLFSIIDDHSRLIPHAQFYLRENIDSFRDCLVQAMAKRGLPRRLYVDNGSPFRSHQLRYGCARLGVALLHSEPYVAETRGKIERLHRTIRMQLLPLLPKELSLEMLNQRLKGWIDEEYHQRAHSSTAQSPLKRYLAHLEALRPAPKDLWDYFRVPARRKVDKDRTVSLDGTLFEAPAGLIGKTVTLLYHKHDPKRVEVLLDEKSYGFLSPLNVGINSRVRRTTHQNSELLPLGEPGSETKQYRGGTLFEDQEEQR